MVINRCVDEWPQLVSLLALYEWRIRILKWVIPITRGDCREYKCSNAVHLDIASV